MDWFDLVNGCFELGGSFAIMLSIMKLNKDKLVAGVSWVHTAWFASWGLFNIFYYTHLGQPLSFYGGVAIVICNTIWLCQLIYYTKNPIKAQFVPTSTAEAHEHRLSKGLYTHPDNK